MQFDFGPLEAAYERGRLAWPGVALTRERFSQRTAEAQIAPEDLARHAADLVLAYACAEHDPVALRRLEEEILARVDLYVGRIRLGAEALDDLRQQLRMKLLTGNPPAITKYRGRGPLSAWVRVTTIRLALDLMAASGAETRPADIDLLEMSAPVDDSPELVAARLLYRQRFQAGLEVALRALSARDKALLRLHVIEELGVEAIGKIYRVHRATAARWLVAIRARIFESLRKDLGLRQAASPSELRSLAGLLRDDIHISAERILAASRG